MKIKTICNNLKHDIVKHSPTILLVSGIVGVGVGTVMACVATTKVKPILDEAKESLEKIESTDETEIVKAKAKIYGTTGFNITKKYVPSALVMSTSIACLIGSNVILKGRNAALTAAYGTLFTSYEGLKKKVEEKVGPEVARQILYDETEEIVEYEEVDPETGKTKKKKKKLKVVTDINSPYARFFDQGSCFWEKDPDHNFLFLRSNLNYWNEKLRIDGRVFLNDVYRSLGLEPCKEGQIVGWRYSDDNQIGDNYIDFGLYDYFKESNRRFIDGYEPVILLDFNVDGNVWDDMKEGA